MEITSKDATKDHSIIEKFYSEQLNLNPPPALELYHYTTSEAFIKIHQNNSLWATECRYLNDPSEIKYGLNSFYEAMEKFITSEGAQSVLKHFLEFLKQEKEHPTARLFITSFSEERDLLSQWRGYGDNGKGLSVGFTFPKDTKFNHAHTWGKVIYDDRLKEESISNIISSFKNSWDEIIKLPSEESYDVLTQLFTAFLSCSIAKASMFKKNVWAEEKEWRFVSLIIKKKHLIKVRSKNSDLIEYIEHPIGKNVITSATVGPRSNFINQQRALLSLTQNNIPIQKSEIPWL